MKISDSHVISVLDLEQLKDQVQDKKTKLSNEATDKKASVWAIGVLGGLIGFSIGLLGVACIETGRYFFQASKDLSGPTKPTAANELNSLAIIWDPNHFAHQNLASATCQNQLFKSPSIFNPSHEFLKEYAKVVCGHLDFNRSKVVFLSDVHTDHLQEEVRRIFFESVIKDGDVILKEGFLYEPNATIFKVNFPTQRRVEIKINGWESKELDENTLNLKRELFEEACVGKKLRTMNFNHLMHLSKEQRDKVIHNEFKKRRENLAKHSKKYEEIYKKFMNVAVASRNERMAEIIREILPTLTQGERIFVVAGTAHLDAQLLKQFESDYTAIFFKNFPKPIFNGRKRQSFTIALPDGTQRTLNDYWFASSDEAKVGQEVRLTPYLFNNSTLSPTLRKILTSLVKPDFLEPERKYPVVNIPNGSFVNETFYELHC